MDCSLIKKKNTSRFCEKNKVRGGGGKLLLNKLSQREQQLELPARKLWKSSSCGAWWQTYARNLHANEGQIEKLRSHLAHVRREPSSSQDSEAAAQPCFENRHSLVHATKGAPPAQPPRQNLLRSAMHYQRPSGSTAPLANSPNPTLYLTPLLS